MLRDNPEIEMTERTGYPYPIEEDLVCPECGEVCDYVYVRKDDGEVVGCDRCLREVDVEECPDILER